MSTRQVSYKEYTCDGCGKEASVSRDFDRLPDLWSQIYIAGKTFDLCLECGSKVEKFIHSIKG